MAGRIAIVDIDDLSLSTIGQWPWRRDRIAQLIARLREQGAAVIALDVVFAEADRSDTDAKQPSPWDARSHEEAVQLIVRGRGTHFDPDVVDAFVRIAPQPGDGGTVTEFG